MDILFLISILSLFVIFLKLIFQLTNLLLKFFDLIALEIDKLKHLEVLFFIFTKDSQQLLEILYLSSGLDFSEILTEFLDFLHLL